MPVITLSHRNPIRFYGCVIPIKNVNYQIIGFIKKEKVFILYNKEVKPNFYYGFLNPIESGSHKLETWFTKRFKKYNSYRSEIGLPFIPTIRIFLGTQSYLMSLYEAKKCWAGMNEIIISNSSHIKRFIPFISEMLNIYRELFWNDVSLGPIRSNNICFDDLSKPVLINLSRLIRLPRDPHNTQTPLTLERTETRFESHQKDLIHFGIFLYLLLSPSCKDKTNIDTKVFSELEQELIIEKCMRENAPIPYLKKYFETIFNAYEDHQLVSNLRLITKEIKDGDLGLYWSPKTSLPPVIKGLSMVKKQFNWIESKHN